MTPDQQLRALGISADAFEGLVIIEVERPFMSLTPGEVRRFHTFLERAYRDALGRERQKEAGRA